MKLNFRRCVPPSIWSYGFIYSVVRFQSNVSVSNWTYLKVFTSLWQADCNNQQKAKWLAVHHPFVPIRQIDTLNCAATTRFFDANWTQQKLRIRRLYFKFFLKNFSIFLHKLFDSHSNCLYTDNLCMKRYML